METLSSLPCARRLSRGEAMSNRVVPLRSICLVAILMSMVVSAQSARAPVITQPNRLITPESQQGINPTFTPMPQAARFARHRQARVSTRMAPSISGPTFASAVTYDSGGAGASFVAVADRQRQLPRLRLLASIVLLGLTGCRLRAAVAVMAGIAGAAALQRGTTP